METERQPEERERMARNVTRRSTNLPADITEV
jgi:hypothetical protein